MEQTLILRKVGVAALMLGSAASLPGCASDTTPSAATATVTPAAAMTMRSRGYAAPEVPIVASSPSSAAMMMAAVYVASEADAAPAMSTESAFEEKADALPTVPAPTQAAYDASPRPALPDLDAIMVLDEREPVRTAQVYEGETRSVMPEREPVEVPSFDEEELALPDPVPTRSTGGSALHLASYRDAAHADEGWRVLTRDHPQILAGLFPARTSIDLPGRGTFVRLIAGPLEPGAARTACAALEMEGAYCAVTDWSGERF